MTAIEKRVEDKRVVSVNKSCEIVNCIFQFLEIKNQQSRIKHVMVKLTTLHRITLLQLAIHKTFEATNSLVLNIEIRDNILLGLDHNETTEYPYLE